jgi:hypothetical protein
MNRPIYGTIQTGPGKSQYSCVYTLAPDMDINTYLVTLKSIFTQLSTTNNRDYALDRIAIMEEKLKNIIATNTP